MISLPENRSTGYRWMLADDPVVGETTPEPERFGAAVDQERMSEDQATL